MGDLLAMQIYLNYVLFMQEYVPAMSIHSTTRCDALPSIRIISRDVATRLDILKGHRARKRIRAGDGRLWRQGRGREEGS